MYTAHLAHLLLRLWGLVIREMERKSIRTAEMEGKCNFRSEVRCLIECFNFTNVSEYR